MIGSTTRCWERKLLARRRKFQMAGISADKESRRSTLLRGIYTGASGMAAQQHRLNAISNNLANVDLNGYKRDISVLKSFPEMLIRRTRDNGEINLPIGSMDTAPVVGKIGIGVEYNETYTVFSQGALKQTDNPFDLAMEGEGFFVIDTPQGERYTRNGAFTLGKEGYLVTKDGYPVLGNDGPIQLKLNNFTVDAMGRIFHNSALDTDPQSLVSQRSNDWAETELLDELRIVNFPRDRYLKKAGNSFWTETVESGSASRVETGGATKIRQGFLEGSNVNPVTEMVRMIEVNRNYEANQKMIQTQDSLLGRLLNEGMRV
jgi:flagellar basal-body rod protein FlgF